MIIPNAELQKHLKKATELAGSKTIAVTHYATAAKIDWYTARDRLRKFALLGIVQPTPTWRMFRVIALPSPPSKAEGEP